VDLTHVSKLKIIIKPQTSYYDYKQTSGAIVEEVEVPKSAEVANYFLFDEVVAHLYDELDGHQLVLVAASPA
jgi:hypothetical protein